MATVRVQPRMVRKLDLHEDAIFRHCGSAVEIMGFEYAEIAVSGWMNHRQLQVIEYLREENRCFENNWVSGECASMTISAGDWP